MQSIQKTRLLAAALVFTLFSCFHSNGQQQLPASWIDGMVLKASYGGGMRNYSTTLEITRTGGYIEVQDNGRVSRTELKFTQQQLDSLLAVMIENKFNQVQTTREMIYDKATTSISLSWDNKHFSISHGSSAELVDAWRKPYYTVRNYIEKMTGF